MNKDKAIQLLERLQDPEPYEPMLTKDAYDAIQMAIDALSADGDTISRKAAIDAVEFGITYAKKINKETGEATALFEESNAELEKAIDRIKQLPPTQPEPDIDDVTCENCYYSERFVDGLILCRRTKTSHRVSATSTCGKGKREAEDAEAKV